MKQTWECCADIDEVKLGADFLVDRMMVLTYTKPTAGKQISCSVDLAARVNEFQV